MDFIVAIIIYILGFLTGFTVMAVCAVCKPSDSEEEKFNDKN
jgi:hypothetical protein